ncbi:hypothetical protein DFS34DRAFT_592224 [Phlyctochytrium arcticum]|nr:hypothetical protein DFS34DRAFT_592224 [Phlyctochytrium arcticum]
MAEVAKAVADNDRTNADLKMKQEILEADVFWSIAMILIGGFIAAEGVFVGTASIMGAPEGTRAATVAAWALGVGIVTGALASIRAVLVQAASAKAGSAHRKTYAAIAGKQVINDVTVDIAAELPVSADSAPV